jgi:hypothetical protein
LKTPEIAQPPLRRPKEQYISFDKSISFNDLHIGKENHLLQRLSQEKLNLNKALAKGKRYINTTTSEDFKGSVNFPEIALASKRNSIEKTMTECEKRVLSIQSSELAIIAEADELSKLSKQVARSIPSVEHAKSRSLALQKR